jgi:signal transduction histidine kinase
MLVPGSVRFWVGDVVGILVTAPLLLILSDAQNRAKLARLLKRPESYLQVALILATLWIIVSGLEPQPSQGLFLLFPPLIWVALRAGLAGALVAIALVQLGIIAAFHLEAQATLPIVELQLLVATLTLTGLYLGVMVGERERTLERLNESLRFAAAGEMAGAITHEVSQPLTALASYARTAKLRTASVPVDAEWEALVDKMLSEAQRASRVVRRLREFFRAGSIRLQPVAAAELVALIRRVGTEVTQGTAVRLSIVAADDLPAIPLDRLQIEVVLRNLMGNAVDSLQAHRTAGGAVAVEVRKDESGLRIAIADNGPGITGEARDELFRPLASRKPNGMGLGLVVSRAIAEAHGGSLDVAASAHGEFHLRLPFEPAHG